MLHLTMKMKISTVALTAMLFAGLSLTSSFAQVGISIGIAPPPIPIYEQPYAPAAGNNWTGLLGLRFRLLLGPWRLDPSAARRIPMDPGILGLRRAARSLNEGYWGPTVGFYGGINYGYGYGGQGYYGGRWVGNTFRYNTAVTRVNRE